MDWLRKLGRAVIRLPMRLKLVWLGVVVALSFTMYQGFSAFSRIQTMPFESPLVADVVHDESANVDVDAPDEFVSNAALEREEAIVGPHPSLQPALPEPTGAKPPTVFDELIIPVAVRGVVEPGWRRDEHTTYWYYETATWLHAPAGSPVVAAAPGVVTATVPAAGGGWNVRVEHDGGWDAVYGSVYELTVAPGNALSGHARLGTVMKGAAGESADIGTVSFAAFRDDEALDVLALLPDE